MANPTPIKPSLFLRYVDNTIQYALTPPRIYASAGRSYNLNKTFHTTHNRKAKRQSTSIPGCINTMHGI